MFLWLCQYTDNAKTNIVNTLYLPSRFNKWCWHLDIFAFTSVSFLLNKYNVANTVDATLFSISFQILLLHWHQLLSVPSTVLYFTTYMWSVNSSISHVFLFQYMLASLYILMQLVLFTQCSYSLNCSMVFHSLNRPHCIYSLIYWLPFGLSNLLIF